MTTDVRHTNAWRRLRRAWATRLPQPCPYCHELVHPWQTWHLDHATPVKYGGSHGPTRPAHAACNIRAGHDVAMDRRVHVPLNW